MLEFVVVDDNKFLNEQIQDVINGVLMKTKIDYVYKIFYDYDSVFFELVNDDSENRVYVLDLQTPHSSGLTAIRTIREHDKHSKIIIISDYCDDHFPEIFKLKYILQTIKKDNELLTYIFVIPCFNTLHLLSNKNLPSNSSSLNK